MIIRQITLTRLGYRHHKGQHLLNAGETRNTVKGQVQEYNLVPHSDKNICQSSSVSIHGIFAQCLGIPLAHPFVPQPFNLVVSIKNRIWERDYISGNSFGAAMSRQKI